MAFPELGRETLTTTLPLRPPCEVRLYHYDATEITREPGPWYCVSAGFMLVGRRVATVAYDRDRAVARAKVLLRVDDLLAGRARP